MHVHVGVGGGRPQRRVLRSLLVNLLNKALRSELLRGYMGSFDSEFNTLMRDGSRSSKSRSLSPLEVEAV